MLNPNVYIESSKIIAICIKRFNTSSIYEPRNVYKYSFNRFIKSPTLTVSTLNVIFFHHISDIRLPNRGLTSLIRFLINSSDSSLCLLLLTMSAFVNRLQMSERTSETLGSASAPHAMGSDVRSFS